MNEVDVMDQVGDQLDTIAGLRVFRYPPDNVSPPAAIVSYSDIEYDGAFARGMDRMTLPVLVVVGRVSERKSRDKLAAYRSGSGAKSIKAVIEAGTYTAFDTVRVTSAEADAVDIAGVTYVAATFSLDIAGPGS